jgi:hypothetical protein
MPYTKIKTIDKKIPFTENIEIGLKLFINAKDKISKSINKICLKPLRSAIFFIIFSPVWLFLFNLKNLFNYFEVMQSVVLTGERRCFF